MMQGRRHWRPPHGKARAMACGGNPRALPDFCVEAVSTLRLTIWRLRSRVNGEIMQKWKLLYWGYIECRV